MDWMLLIAGLVAAFTTFGHFHFGNSLYLRPMIQAQFDEVAKNVMHSVFHYVSIFLILSSAALLALGFGVNVPLDIHSTAIIIALNYSGFACIEIIIALTSKIEKALFKMFHWIFFTIIAALTWLSVF